MGHVVIPPFGLNNGSSTLPYAADLRIRRLTPRDHETTVETLETAESQVETTPSAEERSIETLGGW